MEQIFLTTELDNPNFWQVVHEHNSQNEEKGVIGSDLTPLEEVRTSELTFVSLPDAIVPYRLLIGVGGLMRILKKEKTKVWVQELENGNGLRSYAEDYSGFYRVPLLCEKNP